MEIWLDTVDLSLIEEAHQMGILSGVTTNPTILAKSPMTLEDLAAKILSLQSGPIAVQVTAQDSSTMIQQAQALQTFSKRILVKIPATGEGWKTVRHCASQNISTMVTAVFDQNQVLLAAAAKTTYIAPCFSQVCEEDMNGIASIASMLRLLHRYHYPAKLLAASLCTAEQVKECTELGVHAITLNEKAFKDLIEDHPYTLQSLERFEKDWVSAKKRWLPLPIPEKL